MIRQAVILCGGLGTRLGTLTAKTPKPLLSNLRRPRNSDLEGHVVDQAGVGGHGGRRNRNLGERLDDK